MGTQGLLYGIRGGRRLIMGANAEQEKVKVLEEYAEDISFLMDQIAEEMSGISTNASTITNCLCHGKWEGDARDKCLSAYNSLYSYYHNIDDCYRDYKAAMLALLEDVDGFVENSPEVGKLF